MIFYFTGTGNSLYAARCIAQAVSDSNVRSISQEMHGESHTYAADAIGFVVPVYAHDIPFIVKEFIANNTFDAPYVYMVLTYGNRHATCVEAACNYARDHGLNVDYAATLLMVDNWLPSYDVAQQLSIDKHIPQQLERITADIASGAHSIEAVTDEDREAHRQLLKWGMEFTPQGFADFLTITDACTGCSMCANVCPSSCISLENGVAVREPLRGLGCTTCLACVHVCPAHAITMKMGDKNPQARFRNEHVSLQDLYDANGWQE